MFNSFFYVDQAGYTIASLVSEFQEAQLDDLAGFGLIGFSSLLPAGDLERGFLWIFWAKKMRKYGYGSIPINTIFSGMNIHLPAVLIFKNHHVGMSENGVYPQ